MGDVHISSLQDLILYKILGSGENCIDFVRLCGCLSLLCISEYVFTCNLLNCPPHTSET